MNITLEQTRPYSDDTRLWRPTTHGHKAIAGELDLDSGDAHYNPQT